MAALRSWEMSSFESLATVGLERFWVESVRRDVRDAVRLLALPFQMGVG